MEAKIIKERERITVKNYYLEYLSNDSVGHGYNFPCNEKGELIPLENKYAIENYNECIAGTNNTTFEGIQVNEHSYTNPAILQCHCKSEVVLYGFTNTCKCGSDYNSFGQLLASRKQWGEDTGESLSDILSIR